MTGVELLILFGGAATLCSAVVALWVFRTEREKAILLSSLNGFDVLEERRGNIDKPLGMLLRGKDAVVDVDAVLRGEHPLWQLRQRDVWAPRLGAMGRIVIVDVEWREAVRELRELQQVCALTARYVVYAEAVHAAAVADAFAERTLSGDVITLLRLPVAAKCAIVAPERTGRASVFLELPRTALRPDDAKEAIARLRELSHVVEGARGEGVGVKGDVGAASPSGTPCAVPSLA